MSPGREAAQHLPESRALGGAAGTLSPGEPGRPVQQEPKVMRRGAGQGIWLEWTGPAKALRCDRASELVGDPKRTQKDKLPLHISPTTEIQPFCQGASFAFLQVPCSEVPLILPWDRRYSINVPDAPPDPSPLPSGAML